MLTDSVNMEHMKNAIVLYGLLLKHLSTLLAYAALKVDKSIYKLHVNIVYRIYKRPGWAC